MVTDTLTVADIERRLNDVLDSVRRGEQNAIERDGEVTDTIVPPDFRPGITWAEFVAIYNDLPQPDPGLADELERIQAEQPPMANPPEWPD
jgi:antitoxin (DNA-binding transcriptional repressor) of toxin-antitoxin stability system